MEIELLPYLLWNVCFLALFMWLPLVAADNAGGVARMLRLPLSTVPVSRRWLGENKTLAPYYLGPLFAYAVTWAEFWWQGYEVSEYSLVVISLLGGVGAVLGDHTKSFIKRRLGMSPGTPWFPFDQIDYAVGGGIGYLVWYLISNWTPFILALMINLVIVLLALLTKAAGNRLLYHIGGRKTPH